MSPRTCRRALSSVMYLLFLSLACISAAVVKLENAGGGLICIPNATFHIDCNRCKCSPTGMSIDCTDWSCATLTIPHDLLLNVTLNCWPSDIFLYERQKCLCSESGSWALCTSAHRELALGLRPVSGYIVPIDDRVALGARRQCAPGLVFKSGCDTCICDDNGRPACLGLGCVTERPASDDDCNDPPAKLCVPQAAFSVDCNQCSCSNDGSSYSCDPYPCLGVEMRDDQLLNLTFPCEAPGASFLYNGRECLCAWDGRHALCSGGNRASFQDLAREYHAAGKQVFTIADLPELCTPGIVLKDSCNVCICGANEKPACTRMDCEMGWRESRDAETETQQEQERIIARDEVWVQRPPNRRFCRNHPASPYCKFFRNY